MDNPASEIGHGARETGDGSWDLMNVVIAIAIDDGIAAQIDNEKGSRNVT